MRMVETKESIVRWMNIVISSNRGKYSLQGTKKVRKTERSSVVNHVEGPTALKQTWNILASIYPT